ncbi:MAG: DUF58 domain-containing protein [Actinobacteria bacterium]|nr:DUF58 domain-containing protein [Actinomycetota bacterium]
MVAAAAVLVAALLDAFRGVDPARVAIRRDAPAVVALDGEGEITWVVGNPVGRPLDVVLADALPPSLGAERRRASVRVPPGGRATAATAVRPSRRGNVDLATLTVRTIGPWGLASRQHTRDLATRIEVHPSFRSRREAELRLTRGRLLEVGLRAARGRGTGTEFEALRDYVPGDEVRRVDWSATARTGRPIVRTYRSERNQTVLALLDTGRTTAATVDGVPRLDHAMDALMALTTAATRVGDRVGLLAFGSGHRGAVVPSRGGDQLRRVVRAMYALEPELAESDYRGAFRRTLATFPRRALLVLFTELADEAVAETLVPALPLVLREHVLLVASVRDPEIADWSTAGATDTTSGGSAVAGAYLTAAAGAAVRRRERTAGYLRRLGVTVVDEPPGRLAGALVDAYLDLKSRGRV